MTDAIYYAEILSQALAERAPLPPGPAGMEWTEAAEELGDSIYRLCIEFGVPFNSFLNMVLSEVPPAPTNEEGADQVMGDLLLGTEPHSDLVVFALELMREDTDF